MPSLRVPADNWACPYFLDEQNTPGSSCVLPAPDLEPATAPRTLPGSLHPGVWLTHQAPGVWLTHQAQDAGFLMTMGCQPLKPFQWTQLGISGV